MITNVLESKKEKKNYHSVSHDMGNKFWAVPMTSQSPAYISNFASFENYSLGMRAGS